MALKLIRPPVRPRLPLILQRRSNDEYTPLPYHPLNTPVVSRVRAEGPKQAARLGISLGNYWSSRQGTAAALRALDEAWGGGFYNVPPDTALDREAADATLGGKQLVIDVQTHYITDHVPAQFYEDHSRESIGLLEAVGGDSFSRHSPDRTTFPGYSSRRDAANYNLAFQGRQMRPDSLKFLLSWTNHRPAKRKISKPLVYDQVSSLGSPFALYDPVTVINPDAPKVD